MIDTKKIPHLQPEPQPSASKINQDVPATSFIKQVLDVFSSKKGKLLLFAIILFPYISICFQGERALRNGIYSALQSLGKDGFGISYEAPSSYPAFKSGVNLDNLVISAPAKMGSWTFKASRLTVTSSPFSPNQVQINLTGTHSLTTSSIGEMRLIFGQGNITIHKETKKSPFAISAEFRNIQSASPKSMEGFFITTLSLKADKQLKKENKYVLAFNTVLENMRLPAYLAIHLPNIMEYANLTGELEGINKTSASSMFSNWVSNGGTAEITQGEVIWKPFMTTFTGTFGLNNNYELTGASVAKVYGFFDLLDMFAKGRYIRSSQVSMAKIVLGVNEKKLAGENQKSIEAPFSFQTGKIYADSVLIYDKKNK